jgi:hypothetical protein
VTLPSTEEHPSPEEQTSAGAEVHPIDPARAAEPASELAGDGAGSRRARWLVVALVLVTGLLGWQLLRADALATQVGVLTENLAVAQAEIRAHEQRMGTVRSHVDDLSARIAALQSLVAE